MKKHFQFFSIVILCIVFATVSFAQTDVKSPKNIILMISDGWGYNQILATDYYEHGRTNIQVYQSFPVELPMSTYMSNEKDGTMAGSIEGAYAPDRAWTWFDYIKQKPTDSAASATAFAAGVKTYSGAIGVDVNQNPLELITQRAEKLGKATGVVTSVEWSHATPAAMAAHNVTRNNYEDIAKEMIYNTGLDVIMGAGSPLFDDDGVASTSNSYKYVGGESTWDALVAGTAGNDSDGDGRTDYWTLVQTKEDFEALLNGTTPKRVCGTAQVYKTLQYNRSGVTSGDNTTDAPFTDALIATVPTLEVMTKGALNILDNDPDGFFLMVEGGAVDWAGHGNTTARLIEEQMDFNASVEAAVQWINQNSNWDETLLIVTGDHETGFLTGPGSGTDDAAEGSETPTWTGPANNGKGVLPTTEWHSGSHTNQLIPLYARGTGSDLLIDHADEYDEVKGYFLTNSEVGQVMKALWPEPRQMFMAPKNIVLLISDGWGYNQVLATDYYEFGQTGMQVYQQFPYQYAMSHYMSNDKDGTSPGSVEGGYEPDRAWTWFDYVKQKATDSAASATSFSTGVKTYSGSIGLDAQQNPLEHAAELAEKMGKATGVVSSVQFAHATPAAMAAHNVNRSNYAEIANEMIYNSGLDVIMGAGNPLFDNDGLLTTSTEYKYVGGETTWDALNAGTAGNDADSDGTTDYWTLIQAREDFQKLATGETPKRVIGVPRVRSTLQYSRSGVTASTNTTDPPYTDSMAETIPTLEEMTEAALNILDNDNDGFYLMVEGGAVDWAGHGNTTARLIEEQIDFNNAVEAVVRWVNLNSNWNETLIIVTGDHETGYLTGPGSGTDDAAEGSETPVWTTPTNNGAGNLPTTEWHSGGHTNQLIPLYAKGAGSELLVEYADNVDDVRGMYLDNAEIGQHIKRMIKLNSYGSHIVTTGQYVIASIKDIPNDQGKKVMIGWTQHPLEADGTVVNYSIYRKVADGMQKASELPAGNWEFIKEVPTIGMPEYSSTVETLADSTVNSGMYESTFIVIAHTDDPEVFYQTAPRSGYSIDNLSPDPVQNLRVQAATEGNMLVWTESNAADFAKYAIFRGSNIDFEVSESCKIGESTEATFTDDSAVTGSRYYYKVATYDFSGNYSITSVDVTTGINDGSLTPDRFQLTQNYPNPFNPVTSIEYSIPKSVHVKITVYNTLGQVVSTLVNQIQGTGVYKVQWDASNMASGMYLYKLEAGSVTMMKKMMLIK